MRDDVLSIALGRVSGGLIKRIDENRELLEYLRGRRPELLRGNPGIDFAIQSLDRFYRAILWAIPPTEMRHRMMTGTLWFRPSPWCEPDAEQRVGDHQ